MPAVLFRVSEADLPTLNYDRHHYPDPIVQKWLHAVTREVRALINNTYITADTLIIFLKMRRENMVMGRL